MARLAAAGGIVAAVALVGVLMFGSSNGQGLSAVFDNAGQLVVGNQVQVGGTPVGEVTGIELTDDGRARIEMQVEGDVAPLHRGTTAVIRATSLSGIANRYVSLEPGPNDAEEIPEGGEIHGDDTTAPVDLDQLFNALDGETREGLQQLVQGFAAQYEGKGTEANESLRYLNPALSTASALTRELVRDQQAFEDLVVDTSELVTAVAERRDDLAGLVRNAGTTADAIGDENAALSRALATVPGTLRKSNTTFVNLRATVDDLDVLVEESKPATRDLARLFRELRPLVDDAQPTVEDLRFLIRRRGEGNDLIELTSKMPRLADLAETAWPRAIQTMQQSQPVLEYVRPYVPDLAGYITKFGQGGSPYDANGHYARIQPIFNAFSFADNPLGGLLNAIPALNRIDGLETRAGQRCPGGAAPPPPDGSAPYRPSDDFDCDPAASPGTP
ncbi:MAG: MlaD family protein [Thermoleophilaceae bacterium]